MPSSRVWRALLLGLLLLVASGAWATSAQASAFGKTFADYKAHGKINACKFSVQELKQAKSQVPPDIEQYAPDFPAALDAALQAHARGACPKGAGAAGGGGASTPAPGAGAGGVPASPAGATPGPAAAAAGGGTAAAAPGTPGATPAPSGAPAGATNPESGADHATGSGRSTAPAPLILIAVLAALLALAALAWLLAQWRGRDPAWLARTRHACAEAGFRTGITWSEFTDWVRLGR